MLTVVLIVPPLHHNPAVAGTKKGVFGMLAVNGVMTDALESSKVPLVSVKPPASRVITDCTSSTLEVLVPLFTVIPPPNAEVAAVPLIVLDAAPVKVTLPVPWLKEPLLVRLPAIVMASFAVLLLNVPLIIRLPNDFVPAALVIVSVLLTVVVPVTI